MLKDITKTKPTYHTLYILYCFPQHLSRVSGTSFELVTTFDCDKNTQQKPLREQVVYLGSQCRSYSPSWEST